MQAAETLSTRVQPVWTLSSPAAGAIALADGVMTLTAVALSRASWILMGIALIVWIICGWSIYFRPRPEQPVVALLGSVLLASAGVVALGVLSALYLLVLGPSWIL